MCPVEARYNLNYRAKLPALQITLKLLHFLGDTMHAREFSRQQQEAMIASGALNKMTSLGMPQSRRSA